MINDGSCYLHIPVALTLSKLSESGASVINALHAILDLPLVSAGDSNPYYLQITEVALASGIDRSGPLAVIGPVKNIEYIPVSMVDMIVHVGGDVEGLPVWFELSADPATVDCPFSTDTPKEKWSTWGTFGQSHVPTAIGNKWYRSSAVGESGSLMNASWWSALSRGNVISLTQFQAILSENVITP